APGRSLGRGAAAPRAGDRPLARRRGRPPSPRRGARGARPRAARAPGRRALSATRRQRRRSRAPRPPRGPRAVSQADRRLSLLGTTLAAWILAPTGLHLGQAWWTGGLEGAHGPLVVALSL